MSSTNFRIAASQLSSFPGDIAANVRHHVQCLVRANEFEANVVIFPELSLTGYEPAFSRKCAIDAQDDLLQPLQAVASELNIALVAGCPIRSQSAKPYLGAFIIRPHEPVEIYRKRFLHHTEEEHFVASEDNVVFSSHGHAIGVAICADLNNPQHAAAANTKNATIYTAGVAITPNGIGEAEANMAKYACDYGILTVMANYASATGGYSVAGRSAIWDNVGNRVAQAPEVGECLVLAEATANGWTGQVVNL